MSDLDDHFLAQIFGLPVILARLVYKWPEKKNTFLQHYISRGQVSFFTSSQKYKLKGPTILQVGRFDFCFQPHHSPWIFFNWSMCLHDIFSTSTLYDFFVVWVGWKSRLSVLNQTTMEMWNNLWTSDGNFLRVFDWPWNSAHWYFNAG